MGKYDHLMEKYSLKNLELSMINSQAQASDKEIKTHNLNNCHEWQKRACDNIYIPRDVRLKGDPNDYYGCFLVPKLSKLTKIVEGVSMNKKEKIDKSWDLVCELKHEVTDLENKLKIINIDYKLLKLDFSKSKPEQIEIMKSLGDESNYTFSEKIYEDYVNYKLEYGYSTSHSWISNIIKEINIPFKPKKKNKKDK